MTVKCYMKGDECEVDILLFINIINSHQYHKQARSRIRSKYHEFRCQCLGEVPFDIAPCPYAHDTCGIGATRFRVVWASVDRDQVHDLDPLLAPHLDVMTEAVDLNRYFRILVRVNRDDARSCP